MAVTGVDDVEVDGREAELGDGHQAPLDAHPVDAGDVAVDGGFVGRLLGHVAVSMARSRSATTSAGSSMPTERHTRSGVTPASRCSSSLSCWWVVLAGWTISVFASPTFARNVARSTSSQTRLPASYPPRDEVPLDVGGHQRRVADGLEVDEGGVLVDGVLVGVVVERVDEPRFDPPAGCGVGEVGGGAAIQRLRGDDVVARFREQEGGGVERGHAGRGSDGAGPAFEVRQALLEYGVGRVHDPTVDVARSLQREQRGGMVDVLELVGGLVDRRCDCPGRGVDLLARVDAPGRETTVVCFVGHVLCAYLSHKVIAHSNCIAGRRDGKAARSATTGRGPPPISRS